MVEGMVFLYSDKHNIVSTKPNILWSLMYRVSDSSMMQRDAHDLCGVHVTSGPDAQIDFDFAIHQVCRLI